MSWTINDLPSWEYYSQNNSPTDDGQYDENAQLDCGPTCLSMVIRQITGVRVYPDTIKDGIEGQGAVGITYSSQLQQYLSDRATITSTLYVPTEAQNSQHYGLLDIEWAYLTKGKPLLHLTSLGTFAHWRVVIGMSDLYVFSADPWNGSRYIETWSNHWSSSHRYLIGIERTRSIVLS